VDYESCCNDLDCHVRQATQADLPWINSQYDEIEFVQSDLANEFVAIAEFQGERAGLGRVVQINNYTAELGGMFVLPEFRNRGVAHRVIRYLLSYAHRFDTVYCLPFEHLSNFYQGHGFSAVSELSNVPKEVLKKHRWCNQKYKHRTLLLYRNA
jgi:N-acetylglutamate synthase-like GNAT family acetyltransferase